MMHMRTFHMHMRTFHMHMRTYRISHTTHFHRKTAIVEWGKLCKSLFSRRNNSVAA
jgi:hypothetical protein